MAGDFFVDGRPQLLGAAAFCFEYALIIQDILKIRKSFFKKKVKFVKRGGFCVQTGADYVENDGAPACFCIKSCTSTPHAAVFGAGFACRLPPGPSKATQFQQMISFYILFVPISHILSQKKTAAKLRQRRLRLADRANGQATHKMAGENGCDKPKQRKQTTTWQIARSILFCMMLLYHVSFCYAIHL